MKMSEIEWKAVGRRIGLRQAVVYLDEASNAALPIKGRSTKIQRAVSEALKKAANNIHAMRDTYTED